MDKDMHYYGTYALARAAGISVDSAQRIATASQFVDDSVVTDVIVHQDGARFRGEATAHHSSLSSLIDLNNRDNQQRVWIPFHFLPGGHGRTQSQRLMCTRDSSLARQMVAHHLDAADKAYALALLGITAHVYADTFAHYGFSGISSRVNRVSEQDLRMVNGTALVGPLVKRFFEKFGPQGTLLENFREGIMGLAAETTTGALGHGAVATLPDQPYLDWSYAYECPDIAGRLGAERQNARDYEAAAEALHGMFRQFAARRPQLTDKTGGVDFETIRSEVRRLISIEAGVDQRIERWKAAIAAGTFTRGNAESVQDYDCNPWYQDTLDLRNLESPEMASQVPAYQFHQAAALHRDYVMHELLPSHGIYIV